MPELERAPTWELEVVGSILGLPGLVNITFNKCLSGETLNRGPVWRCTDDVKEPVGALGSFVLHPSLSSLSLTTNRLRGVWDCMSLEILYCGEMSLDSWKLSFFSFIFVINWNFSIHLYYWYILNIPGTWSCDAQPPHSNKNVLIILTWENWNDFLLQKNTSIFALAHTREFFLRYKGLSVSMLPLFINKFQVVTLKAMKITKFLYVY